MQIKKIGPTVESKFVYVDPPLSVESSITYLTTSVRQIKFEEAAAALLKNMRVVGYLSTLKFLENGMQ